jgi:hypothetical protein
MCVVGADVRRASRWRALAVASQSWLFEVRTAVPAVILSAWDNWKLSVPYQYRSEHFVLKKLPSLHFAHDDNVDQVKSRRMRWAENVARMGEKRKHIGY